MKDQYVLLTTRQNFVWTSMQEIIPCIEYTWTKLCSIKNFDLKIINVDETSPKQILNILLKSKYIIVAAFNTKIAFFMNCIRLQYNIDSPFIFYLHGLATIALWPLYRFNVLNLMNSNDIFIGTCEGDYNCLKAFFSNFKYHQSSFFIIDRIPQLKFGKAAFVYIGRISPQKNLHHLIDAYAELPIEVKNNYPLIIYGQEDNLGHPNLGISNLVYLEDLKTLILQNRLDENVVLKGFVPRNLIEKELNLNQIFVSVSTHSDENFGMASYRSLLLGQNAILTSWGGHKNFIKNNSKLIEDVPVVFENNFPIPNKEVLINKLVSSSKKRDQIPYNHIITLEEEIEHLTELLIVPNEYPEKIQFQNLAKSIFEEQLKNEKLGQPQKCFHSPDDPSYHKLINAYAI